MSAAGKGLCCRGVALFLTGAGGEGKVVLRDIECTFPAGAVSVISGATGAGKSSLLHLLACLIRPSQGRVICDSEPVSAWIAAHQDLWRRSVGVIFQHPRLLDRLTVLENVMVPLIPRGIDLRRMRSMGHRALEALGIGALAGEQVRRLSGGESQRLAVARALVASPRIVLADEPTAHQDAEGAERVIDRMHACRRRGAVVVIASHDERLQRPGFADARFRLEEGRLEALT